MSTQFTEEDIETLVDDNPDTPDWNTVLGNGCCCIMPLCPVPTKECESLTSSVAVWARVHEGKAWAKVINTYVNPESSSEESSVYSEWCGFSFCRIWNGEPEGDAYTSLEISYSGSAARTEVYDPPIASTVWGREVCFSEADAYSFSCSGTQNRVTVYSTGFTDGNLPDIDFQVRETYREELAMTEVSGQQTQAYEDWLAEWGSVEDWEEDYDLWQVEHDAWQDASDTSDQEWEDYLASPAYQEWLNGGGIGDPPTPPEEFDDPEPEEPDAAPTQFHPPCTWKSAFTGTSSDYFYDDGLQAGEVTVTPWENYTSSPSGSWNTTYEDEVTPALMIAKARANLDAANWNECANQGSEAVCYSRTSGSGPEHTGYDMNATLLASRFRWTLIEGTMNNPGAVLPDPPDPLPEGQTEQEWEDAWWADHQVPAPYAGTWFKITWDVLEEPDGWNREIDDPDYEPPVPNDPPEPVPQVPDPDAPHRSYYRKGQTWEWTGPADPENPATWRSPWYSIPPPEAPGSRYVVNVRFQCYNGPFGSLPQVTGEGVDPVPPEENFTVAKNSFHKALI